MDYLLPAYDSGTYLPPPAARLVRCLELTTYAAYRSAELTNESLATWMRRCERGDLVVELTTLDDPTYDGQRLGVVEALERDGIGDPTVLVLRTPDGVSVPWEHGTFVRVIDRLEVLH